LNATTRGIGFGYNWGLSLKKGVPEDGYGIVLLTHEVLDKFDVIGGTEIPELIDKHNKLLLITLDNNPEISVMDRLRQMHAKGGEYTPAYEALLSPDAQVMALGAEDLDPDKLSDKIIDKLAEGETDQTDIAHDENKKAKMAHQDYLAARDATLIVYGITKPEQIVSKDLRWDKFSLSPLFQNLPESGPMLGNLRKSLENFGMHSSEKAGNDAYIIFPVTTEFLTSDINQLQAAGITPQDLDRSTTWPLFFSSSEENFSAIYKQLDVISKDEGHVLNSFAKRMLETQGVIASLKDLEDPGAFASYLIMKQGLVEAAEKDARAKLLKGEKT
jgi:hypothetical protein